VQINLKTLILPMICGVGWGGMVWLGLNYEVGEEAEAGSVMLSHVVFFLVWPMTALTISLVPSALLSQTKYARVGNWWCGLSLIALFLRFCGIAISGGGFP
jgi:hypothetical protein